MDRVGLVPVTLAAFGAGLYAIHPTDMAEHLYTYWDRYFAPKWTRSRTYSHLPRLFF
jgi:hypothetical protein